MPDELNTLNEADGVFFVGEFPRPSDPLRSALTVNAGEAKDAVAVFTTLALAAEMATAVEIASSTGLRQKPFGIDRNQFVIALQGFIDDGKTHIAVNPTVAHAARIYSCVEALSRAKKWPRGEG